MTGRIRGREWSFLACMGFAALASGAAPSDTIVLDEVDVTGAKERERDRDPSRTIIPTYEIHIRREDLTRFEVQLRVPRQQQEIRFRRSSIARQATPESAKAVQVSGDRVIPVDGKPLASIQLLLAPNVAEADGLPASIPFGPHASLVNIDYMRLRDRQGDTGIELSFAIHPQTRRCEQKLLLIDEGSDNPNRFILQARSSTECRRMERSRTGDLIFADGVPESLRQAVLEAYEPIAARAADRLGSEPGLIYVAWWPESPHKGYRFEQSWNRNSLLLFNGTAWQQGLDVQQQEALRAALLEEQVKRRIRQTDSPGAFSESAARYLLKLLTAGEARDTSGQLVDALPGWIAGCAKDAANRARVAAARGGVISIDCGLVTQFVYDAVARAQSSGNASLYDTWWRLLGESYRRGASGTTPAQFLATSAQAGRIVQGLLDGTVDWPRFVADLDGIGVGLRVEQDAPSLAVAVLSLRHFRD